MKKFLAILLIAIIACSVVSVVVEEEELDLEKSVVDKVLGKLVKEARKLLEKKGLLKKLKELLIKEGREEGLKFCHKHVKLPKKEKICETIVNDLLKLVK